MDMQNSWQGSEREGSHGAWRGNGQESRRFGDGNSRRNMARYRETGGWQQEDGGGNRLSLALGWFSIGLGLAQIALPHRVAQMIGIRDDRDTCTVIRAVGMREIATGVGLLTQPHNSGWLKARAGGDVMDLALLGAALASDDTDKEKLIMATTAVLGVTVLDLLGNSQLSSDGGGGMLGNVSPMRFLQGNQDGRQQGYSGQGYGRQRTGQSTGHGIKVKCSVTIDRPAEELYSFWRDFENLPRIMSHLESVQVTSERQSHWKAKAPAGMTVEWDAQLMEDEPNSMIAWRSLENADVQNAGVVRFTPAPGGRGTEVQVELQYNPPGGAIGAKIAKLFGEEPEQQIREDLRRFKQLMEAGDVTLSDATIHGSNLRQRPAQPPKEEIHQSVTR